MALLSFTRAKNIKAKSKALPHGGVPNLWLLPSTRENGVGSWVFRFKDPLTKKPAKLTLGRFPALSIAEAAQEARRLADLVRRGTDPRYVPKMGRAPTLQDLVTQYVSVKKQTGVWGSPITERNFYSQLSTYILKPLGRLPAEMITASHVAECLLPIWQQKPAAAARALQQLSSVLSWACDMGLVERDVTRQVSRSMGKPMSAKPKDEQHFPAMRYQDVPRYVSELLRRRESACLAATLFVILNACRVSAACLLEPDELDWDNQIWRVAAKAVGRKTYISRVSPLSGRTMDLLQHSGCLNGPFVFQVDKKGAAVSSGGVSGFVKRTVQGYASDIVGRTPTAHGFRATFKQWADMQGYDDRLSEMQLWHTVGNRVHQAYARDQLVERRREMMEAWADYCFSLAGDFQAA